MTSSTYNDDRLGLHPHIRRTYAKSHLLFAMSHRTLHVSVIEVVEAGLSGVSVEAVQSPVIPILR